MTYEEAVRFMVEQGFQEQAMADYRNKPGTNWSQREFNEALIGHGSVAVKFLRRYLLGERAHRPAPCRHILALAVS